MVNVGAAVALAATLLSAFVGMVTWRLSRAPLWKDLSRLAVVAATTAAFGLLEFAFALPFPRAGHLALAHLVFASGLVVGWAWLEYAREVDRATSTRANRWLGRAALLGAGIALLPGVAVDGTRLTVHPDPIAGGVWRHAHLTPVGIALSVLALTAGLAAIHRLVRAWRAGAPRLGLLAVSAVAAAIAAAFDALVRADVIVGPHVASIALAMPVAAATWAAGRRFVADANALVALRERLEGLVEERTRALAETHGALLQAEKLAALGQFAAGVGHEVNNPAAVVTANLSHLAATLGERPADPEAREIVEESIDAMRRINELVRKLLDAGRLADLPPAAGNVPLGPAVDAALAEVRGRARSDVAIEGRIPDGLLVRGGEDLVTRILTSLISNAVEAIPSGRSGRVAVSARPIESGIRILIEDDGLGMSTDVVRRAFDPFFTTKPVGRGSGLGLPVTRGLVEGIGGQIWLESEPGKGTRAVVELPAGQPG